MKQDTKLFDTMDKDYLYHYTSINSLGFILKNKTLRFNNLTKVDDKDEARFNEKLYGKYCFVSCWTDCQVESIPMWIMYSGTNLNGVRIKLKAFPFENCMNLNSFENHYEDIIKFNSIYEKKYRLIQLRCCKINYLEVNDLDEFHRKDLWDIDQESKVSIYNIGDVGIYKNIYWEFQKEWRYVLDILPLKIDTELVNLPFEFCDVEISKNDYQDMEILMGPGTNEIDFEIVSLLVKEYNPSAKIRNSKLRNRI